MRGGLLSRGMAPTRRGCICKQDGVDGRWRYKNEWRHIVRGMRPRRVGVSDRVERGDVQWTDAVNHSFALRWICFPRGPRERRRAGLVREGVSTGQSERHEGRALWENLAGPAIQGVCEDHGRRYLPVLSSLHRLQVFPRKAFRHYPP